MADGPGGSMSYTALLAEHARRLRWTKLKIGGFRDDQYELIRTGGNYADKHVGYVDEDIAEEIVRRYNERPE